jgi:hypothetical protein
MQATPLYIPDAASRTGGAMRAGILAVAMGALGIGIAFGAELTPAQRTLFDGFSAHRRVAIGYLRTGNADLGAIEVEKLIERWKADVASLGQVEPTLRAALDGTSSQVSAGLDFADQGDLEAARAALEQAGVPLRVWREANGIRLFSDCINEVSTIYEKLDAHRGAQNLAEEQKSIAAAAAETEAALVRCEREADPGVQNDPDFRRLLNGFRNSLRQVSDALRQNDAAYFHRLIIEQRSFERLLVFRFG